MAPIEVSSTVAATPSTIWQTCFEPMKWESWDPDLKEMKNVQSPSASGVGCEEGATCIFDMNDGYSVPVKLSNVEKNKSVNFKGDCFGGTVKFEGKVVISAIDDSTSKLVYSFGLFGLLGAVVSMLKKKEVAGGTQGGLDNMVKLSEEAQKK